MMDAWDIVGLVGAAVFCLAALAVYIKQSGVIEDLTNIAKANPFGAAFLSLVLIPLVIYGATKRPTVRPVREQCDYRVGEAVDLTDGFAWFAHTTFEAVPTNVLVIGCGGAVTNEMTVTDWGQFYFETRQYTNLDLRVNGFYCRDAETNDWTAATVDSYVADQSFYATNWVSGWSGALAHMPNYENPRDYRFWFIGPYENLPEKVIEGGVEIVIDRVVRTAHYVHIEYHPADARLAGNNFTLWVRTVDKIDGQDVLSDWQTLAVTNGLVFHVSGDFVSRYTQMRISTDKEDGR